MKERRGQVLRALCILSFVSILWSAYDLGKEVVKGQPTPEQLHEAHYRVLNPIKEPVDELTKTVTKESIAISEIQASNFNTINLVKGISFFLGFIGVLMMWRLRRKGFWLYLLYCITLLGLDAFYFGGFSVGLIGLIMTLVFDILFVSLYAYQLKRMD